jgi:glycosyltransferase involved in cell wall biosynthesis
MNILWIVNTIFPAPSKILGLSNPVLGGWMYGLAMQIKTTSKINLAVATTYSGKDLKHLEIEGIIYYLIPSKPSITYCKELEFEWDKICNEFKPDLVHIHGTEFTHGLACMRAFPTLKYVISIQGLVSVISNYYYEGIKRWDILKNITIRDIVRLDTILQAKTKFIKRGKFEKEYFLRTNHVIGRTNWDYAHAKKLNPNVEYHFCNESLREIFYTASKWDINQKSDYTIFISQANYPFKGLHQVLKAVALLKKDFDKIRIRIAGSNIIDTKTFTARLKIGGYGSYIKKLIEKLGIQENILFLGSLNEEKMIREIQNCHIFICSSSIENSPNSLGEAQLLGVPCIASFVGGIPDMVKQEETGLLYRFEEIEMLAENIIKIFNNDDLALQLSNNSIKHALIRHNSSINTGQTIDIYDKIINQ